ncbi:MAG: phosphate ABC transporter permease subunit PstC [Acidobacteriota bacterium]
MSRSRGDALLVWALRGAAAVAGAIVAIILVFVFREALPALRDPGPMRFFTDASWHPTEGLYNLAPMLSGTVLVTLGSVLVAAPLGILSGLFCSYYAPPAAARSYRRLIELLAGVPSVVYGFWGLVVLVPLIARLGPPGTSLLAGVAILSLMILPTVALLADSSLRGVPREYVRGAAALGLTRWATVRRVVLPAARPGLFTGVFLATARAAGETMAVLMVCGNVVQTPGSGFDSVRTLTANIALEMAYAMGGHRSALFVSGLVLMVMIVALVAAAEAAGGGRIRV